MDAISLLLMVGRIFEWIANRIDTEEIRADERRKVLAKRLMLMREATGIDDEIERDVRDTPIDDLRKELTR